jgi:hypothetical protein
MAQSQMDKEIDLKCFREIISEVQNQILLSISEKFAQINEKIEIICANQKAFKSKHLNFEKQNKRKNLVLKGITESEKNSKDLEMIVIQIVNSSLNVKLGPQDIDNTMRIGKKSSSPRPILLKLMTEKKKLEIHQNKFKLKGSKIYIEKDLPKSVLNEQFEARKELRSSKNKNSSPRFVNTKDKRYRGNVWRNSSRKSSKNISGQAQLNEVPNSPSHQ